MRSPSALASPKVSLTYSGITRLQRSCPRIIFFISFIILPTIWLICSGFRSTLETDHWHNLRENSVDKPAMASCAIRPFTINSTGAATGLFVFLHGLGDDGRGWCSLFETKKQANIKYVFPNAEPMPVTLNMRMNMPSWFDIASLDMSGGEDEEGIKKAAERIRTLIKKEQEAASIPSNRVILGGFSMGGALALYTGLTHPEELGGMVLLSSWLPLRGKYPLHKQKCPIFQGHGDADPLVKTEYGKMSYGLLKEARKAEWKTDPKIEFKTYPGLQHSSSEEFHATICVDLIRRHGSDGCYLRKREMKDVRDFIKKHLPPI